MSTDPHTSASASEEALARWARHAALTLAARNYRAAAADLQAHADGYLRDALHAEAAAQAIREERA